MARRSNLLRRDGTYYARIYIPVDLLEHFKSEDKKVSLRTKDEGEAKVRLNRELAKWDVVFEDIRQRRDITADDKAVATWQHFNTVLDRDEETRRNLPTPAQIADEEQKVWEKIDAGQIGAHDFVGMINAHADLDLMIAKRGNEQNLRRQKLNALKRHLQTGETSLVDHHAAQFIKDNKLLTQPGTDDYVDLCRRFIRSEIDALERTFERDDGDYSGTPKDPIIKPATGTVRETAAPGETIMELFAIYERENPNQIKPDTLAQARRDVGLFVEHVGANFPVNRIDKKAVREWKALLLQYPVKATETKAFQGMKIAGIVKENQTLKKPVISTTTVNRYLSGFSAFCTWLTNHGYLTTNPAADMFLKKSKEKTTKPFTVEQMNTVFKSPLFTGCQSDDAPRFWSKPGNVQIRDHRFWVPLIMLFSGARPAEIAQLAIDDVREDRGHWIMHITTDGEGDKSVKTDGSIRVVPIHPELVKLGLLRYHAKMKKAGEKRLFPLAERNERGQMIADFSRDFPRYLTKIGVKDGRGLSLYSFRHGAADALRRAGFLDEQFGFILGHTAGTMTQRYGSLPQGMLEQRVELVNAISYPGLSLAHLE